MSERPIRSILVLGGGMAGLSAALAFARALPGTRVGLVATPTDPAALADRLGATLPHVHRFHARIGLDELDLVRSGAATHRLGTRFDGWSAGGGSWHHVHGDYGRPQDAIPFHDLWLRAHREGRALPYDRYSAAARLADAGKFVHPAQQPQSPLATYVYGLSLDPDLYAARLRLEAAKAGVVLGEGALAGVERREDGGVAALILKDGARHEADLFVDASGPAAALLGPGDFEDWGAWLPCDRLLLASSGRRPAATADRAQAVDCGWLGEPAGGGALLAYRSGVTEEGAAREVLRAALGLEEAEAVTLRPGRRTQPWQANVLAIGDAAVALDPLHGLNLHLAQSAISRALDLLPGRDCHPVELAEYNRRTAEELQRVRDFAAAHYLRAGAREGVFWQGRAEVEAPESLAATLALFERRGRIPFHEEETFDRASWAAALIGLGVLPREAGPAASAVDADAAAAGMAKLAQTLETTIAALPAYPDYLARMRSSAPTSSRRA